MKINEFENLIDRGILSKMRVYLDNDMKPLSSSPSTFVGPFKHVFEPSTTIIN